MCVVVMTTRNGVMAEPAYDGVVRDAGDGSQVAYMQPPYKSNRIHAGETAGRWSHRGVVQWREGRGIRMCHRRIEAEAGSMKWTAPITVSKREGYSNQNPVLYYSSETKLTHLYHSQAEAKSESQKLKFTTCRAATMARRGRARNRG